jgi:hypothetical protein
MRTVRREPQPTAEVTVVPVTPHLWAVFGSDRAGADVALGYIDSDGIRFRVGLGGEDLEPYSFATLSEGAAWFAEYRSALTLGTRASE